MAEDFDTEGNSILRGVAQIGPAKPVGYLPLHTIRDILRIEPRVLAQDGAAKGLSAVLFGPTQCCIKSGALYLFDRQSLELLLQSSRPILSASRWPLDPDQFVRRIAREWIEPGHPVVPVIRRAFGEVCDVFGR
jgi:hypothetical protein